MKWVKGILVIGLALQFMGCSLNSEDDGLSVTSMRNVRGSTGPSGDSISVPSHVGWGKVTSNSANYNAVLKSLVYVSGNEPVLGYVDPTASSTGTMFWGSMRASSNLNLNSNIASYLGSLQSNTSQIQLNLEVWDEYAGKEYQGYGVLLPYSFYFGKTNGKYRGTVTFRYRTDSAYRFELRLKDSYGEIVFNGGYSVSTEDGAAVGGIDSSTVSGTLHYKNNNPKTFPGQVISSGGYTKIGNFQVPTCKFFVCQ